MILGKAISYQLGKAISYQLLGKAISYQLSYQHQLSFPISYQLSLAQPISSAQPISISSAYQHQLSLSASAQHLSAACYPQQINQVLLNILVNAGHAIGEKGKIRIHSWYQVDWVCLAISDSGCGIPEENLARLF